MDECAKQHEVQCCPPRKCTDSKLYMAMNLSFACSLRMGEILGLTRDNVHISEDEIAADNAYCLYVPPDVGTLKRN